jgi:hypothetical protein
MFIFGIIIIVAVFIFRSSFKVKPEDRHFQDKLKAYRTGRQCRRSGIIR